MKKQSKLWLILLPLTLALLLGMFAIGAAADTTETVTVDINKFNLSFKDSIYIKYAVKLDGVDANTLTQDEFQLLFWTEPQTVYDKSTAESYAVCTSYTTIDGERNYVFVYDKFVAKNMADVVYSRVYVNVDGTVYYSDVEKYSILQYAYTMMGKLDEAASNDADLRQLMADMLTYGASAQKYLGYKTDRLATFDYYQIKVNGGTLTSDGTTQGLYLENETVEITAPEKDANGMPFSHWANSNGDKVSVDRTNTVTVGTANETYTAVYEKTIVYSQGLKFTSNGDGTCCVSGIGTCKDTDIIIPPVSPEGDSVTSIGRAAFNGCTSLTSITIPDSVTSIGSSAFSGCTSLSSITIPDNVTSIGWYAFFDCTSLSSITIPDSVTSIGNVAFSGCTSLSSITIPDSVTSIGASAFYDCTSLTSVYITDIEAWCKINFSISANSNPLYYAGNLYINNELATNITIPDSVTSIGEWAFFSCTSLTSITIGNSVTSIGNSAFSDCTSLTNITIGNSVTSIGDEAFEDCTGLTNIMLPNSVTSIGDSAFRGCTSLTSITIPDGVTSIGNSAFSDCTSLSSITIPDSVTSIGDGVFYGCTSLSSITIPDSVTSIGNYAFNRCTSLTNITIFDSVTSIGDYAFFGCTSLTSIVIPASVTSIGEGAFWDCTSLTSITIPDSVTSIDDSAFSGCTSFTSITIPDGVTSIGNSAFSDCTSLSSITIPDSVTSIGDGAFYGCTSLSSITIPDSVTSIGVWAFSSCTSLKTVYYGGTASNWSAILIYSSNSYLTNATRCYYSEAKPTDTTYQYWHYVDGVPTVWEVTAQKASEGLTFISNGDGTCYVSSIGTCTDADIIIPSVSPDGDTVTGIGDFAFSCVDMISITIPDTVTSIGQFAFNACASLASITVNEANAYYQSIDGHLYSKDGTTLIRYAPGSSAASFAVPYGVTSIGDDSFDGSTNLTTITIPNSVTSIGNYAFGRCTSLTSITIPDSVTSIAAAIFDRCSALESITLPFVGESIKAETDTKQYPLSYLFGSMSFTGGVKVEQSYYRDSTYGITTYSRYIPTSLTSITVTGGKILYGAFYNCATLTSITISDRVASINTDAFRGCTGLVTITVGEGNANYKSIDGSLYTKDGTTLIRYAVGSAATNFTIPNGVTNIDRYAFERSTKLANITIPTGVMNISEYAFLGCTGLTSIAIPNGVTAINAYTFQDCSSLVSITLPGSVTAINVYAFMECTSLAAITIPNGVTSLSTGVFYGCTSLADVTIPDSVETIGYRSFYKCTSLRNITLPNSVKVIDIYAFEGCTNLTSITIAKSVTSIGKSAFSQCKNLSIVYYGGNVKDWSAISISSNTQLTSATRYYYSEAKPTDTANLYWHYDENGNPVAW